MAHVQKLSRHSRHAVSSLFIPGLFRWVVFSPWWLSLRLKRWRFGWFVACRRSLHHLFSNHWIIGTKYRGMFSSTCRLILSHVNSSALRSEWRLMLLLHLGNKDSLNPGKTGCFLYLSWFIVCLKSLFEFRENNLSLNVCKRSQRSFTVIMCSKAVVDFRLLFIPLYNYLQVNDS